MFGMFKPKRHKVSVRGNYPHKMTTNVNKKQLLKKQSHKAWLSSQPKPRYNVEVVSVVDWVDNKPKRKPASKTTGDKPPRKPRAKKD
jgi:hypothetical protein